VAAVAGNGSASIAFTAGSAGSSPITNYEYSINNGVSWVARSPASTASPLVIGGLSNSMTYLVRLRAVNAVGVGQASDVVSVTPAVVLPSDPYFASRQLWGLNGDFGVNVPSAWSRTFGSSSVVVAVIDTGSTVHPDAGATVAGYDMISLEDTNGDGVPDSAMTANDGDGRDADPSDPGDWVSRSEDASGCFQGCGEDNSSWHGTHVAGTINAAANGEGVVGVAPTVRVQHVRVLGKCGGYTSDIAAGIIWASGGAVPGVPGNSTPARVINMSLGGSGACGSAFQTAINAAVGRGTTVVVAAGNSNTDAANAMPANCSNVIAVAAVDSAGRRASFSNFGSAVDVAAPGVDIYSTLNTGTTGPSVPTYVAYSGTSMAAPHVAGVVALMLSRNSLLTPAQVEAALKVPANVTAFPGGACDPIASSKTCGAGIVNAGKAVP